MSNSLTVCLNQLKLLLWKNYALQKRSVIGTILELAVPALFAIILLPIRTIIKSNDHPLDSNFTAFSPHSFPIQFPSPVPPVPLLFKYKQSGKKIGGDEFAWRIGYTTASNDSMIDDLMNEILLDLGNQTTENFLRFLKMKFTSEEELITNMTSNDEYYRSLAAIIFLNTSSTNFTYKLRLHYSPLNDLENGYVQTIRCRYK